MSFYRTLLAAVAAVALATPVFADDTATTPASTDTNATTTTQSTETSATPSASTEQQGAMSTETKVNVNKASAKDLMKVKGLNAAKARAIVAYRKKHGDFKTLDDLSSVKGFKKMKPDMMKEIQDQLTVE
jgi:competence protein ComEA